MGSVGSLHKRRCTLANRDLDMVMDLPAASIEGQVENEYGTCTISYTLDVNRIIKSVQDDRAGAIATFIGDYFIGCLSERYLS